MSTNPKLIEAILTNDKLSEEEKSKIITEFINSFNEEFPELKYHATKSDVKESELKLIKEIEDIKKEIKEVELKLIKQIKEVELKLTKQIENTKKEIKEVELKLTKQIEDTRKEIKETKFVMLKWQFLFWISQLSAIIAIFYKLK